MTSTVPTTSDWPLPASGTRILLPQPLVVDMGKDPLSRDCYPLALGYYPHAKGHRMARLEPADYLAIYCVDGEGEAWLGEGPAMRVRAGDLLLLPRGIPHHYAAHETRPWSIYWMHLAGQLMEEFFHRLGADKGAVLTPGLHERLVTELRSLLALSAGGYSLGTFLHASGLCRSLLSYTLLLRERREHQSGQLDVETLHLYMQENLDRRLSLDDLAAAAGQPSRYQFIRRYRQLTGQTPMQAFLHMKVARACYLLELTDSAVADIALRFGFEDPYYFSRLFKKVVGVSPARYRHQGAAR